MSKRRDGDKCDIHCWKGKSKWNEIRMKGRTQIIQNRQFCCVGHKKGGGFFFTDQIIVLRAQKSRSVFVEEHSGRGKRRRGCLGRERTAWSPTPPPGKEQPPHLQVRHTSKSWVQLLAMQPCLTGYPGQKWADPVVQVLLNNLHSNHQWMSSVKQWSVQPTDPRTGPIWPLQQRSLQQLIFSPSHKGLLRTPENRALFETFTQETENLALVLLLVNAYLKLCPSLSPCLPVLWFFLKRRWHTQSLRALSLFQSGDCLCPFDHQYAIEFSCSLCALGK